MNIVTRISAAAASVLAGGMLLAPAALADATCTISGNGSGSTNRCTITVRSGGSHGCNSTCSAQPRQVNKAKVKNKVFVISNTGGNKANKNTGGTVSIDTGNSNIDISISNDVNN